MADLNDLVAAWHKSGPGETRPLHEYLGMTREEYAHWARTGRTTQPDNPTPERIEQAAIWVDRREAAGRCVCAVCWLTAKEDRTDG